MRIVGGGGVLISWCRAESNVVAVGLWVSLDSGFEEGFEDVRGPIWVGVAGGKFPASLSCQHGFEGGVSTHGALRCAVICFGWSWLDWGKLCCVIIMDFDGLHSFEFVLMSEVFAMQLVIFCRSSMCLPQSCRV